MMFCDCIRCFFLSRIATIAVLFSCLVFLPPVWGAEKNTEAIQQNESRVSQSGEGPRLVMGTDESPVEAIEQNGVWVCHRGKSIRVTIRGKLFAAYHYTSDVARPYFYPVVGPTGVNMTRNWPMSAGKNEQRDHKHHRGLWFTHGDVNGHDFWSEGRGTAIVPYGLHQLRSGKDSGSIVMKHKWLDGQGRVVCTDTREYTFYHSTEGLYMDFDVTLHASDGKVTLGDTKEGTMAIRLAPTLRVKGKVAQGHIVNSEGDKDKAAWGKRAAWCDYYGPLEGKMVGVAIFDHPSNPRHPTWWHVRDYGLFAANPFGIHDFESKPNGTGDWVIEPGKSATFRYRLFFHEGAPGSANVEKHYKKYIEKLKD